MAFGHEPLDVYRAAIESVGWAYRYCEGLKGHRNAREQLLRASQAAIALNIAEGNGKATDGDRRRYFEYAANHLDTDSDSDPDPDVLGPVHPGKQHPQGLPRDMAKHAVQPTAGRKPTVVESHESGGAGGS